MLDKDLIARILKAAPKYTIAELEEKYPARKLPDGAMTTRFAPSPTGFMHIGGLYQMLINYKLAKQTGGGFFLRVEDTDQKREVDGATGLIIETADTFKIMPSERPLIDGEIGNYGPYLQSQRKDIYHSVVAELLADGRAYPCFLTGEEMTEIRELQKKSGMPTGIYGEFARDRNLTLEEIIKHLDAGKEPSIRLRSRGDRFQKIFCKDTVRGSIAFPQNDEDIVLIKSSDGLPTYHFAHLCDDHFMRTTHVVRGEEWLPSLPLHIQLFNMMNWTPPNYIHTSTLDKLDEETGKQRKLSKRNDPEASVKKFVSDGWPVDSVKSYLLNIINPGFEEEKIKKNATVDSYEIKIKKLPISGALFDMKKLEWWSREIIGGMTTESLMTKVVNWVKEYGSNEQREWIKDTKYLYNILNIERDNPKHVRKDFITWKQTMEEIKYFFVAPEVLNIQSPISKFLETFDISDDKETWWNKIVSIAKELGLKNGEVAMALRVSLTGRENTPDLYSIMQTMGEEMVRIRLGK